MKVKNGSLCDVFAAEIEVSNEDEEGILISSIHELTIAIHNYLKEKGIKSSLTKNVIPGTLRHKSISDVVVPAPCNYLDLLGLIREALNQNNIDWMEPYSEKGTHFRFITPKVSIKK